MKAHVQTDDDRILQCKEKIVSALNDAHIPLSVSMLILESVHLQVQLEMQKGAGQCQTSTTTAP